MYSIQNLTNIATRAFVSSPQSAPEPVGLITSFFNQLIAILQVAIGPTVIIALIIYYIVRHRFLNDKNFNCHHNWYVNMCICIVLICTVPLSIKSIFSLLHSKPDFSMTGHYLFMAVYHTHILSKILYVLLITFYVITSIILLIKILTPQDPREKRLLRQTIFLNSFTIVFGSIQIFIITCIISFAKMGIYVYIDIIQYEIVPVMVTIFIISYLIWRTSGSESSESSESSEIRKQIYISLLSTITCIYILPPIL